MQVRWIRPGRADSNPDLIVVAGNDITKVKRAEQTLEESVRSKDQFIASVSHELRTPLTAVVGLAAELERGGDRFRSSERGELLEMISSQAREMAFIVEDLLVAARADMDEITVVPECILVASSVASVIKELDLAVATLYTDDIRVVADPVRFRQILRNLLVNAGRYGGPQLRVTAEHADDDVHVDVRDDGPPIPAEDRERIFEPYSRARDRPGTTASVGLGLVVSRRLARLMNGDLVYFYDDGRGESVFRVTLPGRSPEDSP